MKRAASSYSLSMSRIIMQNAKEMRPERLFADDERVRYELSLARFSRESKRNERKDRCTILVNYEPEINSSGNQRR